MSSLMIYGIKVGQAFAEDWVLGDIICDITDCYSRNILKWELFGYAVTTLVSVLVQMCYIKKVSLKPERQEERQTLITDG